MNKAFTPFTWKNEPSQDTPLSESMLNRINTGLDVVDNRVITMDTTKADKAEIYSVISGVSLDNKTGIFTFHRLNGTTFTLDTKLEKIITNFTYDRNTQTLHLHLEDGTDMPVDISSFITNVEFTDSETIRHEAGADGTVSLEVIDGSITENKLEPNYLANVKLSESTAKLHAADALESSREAELSAQRAEKAAEEASAAVGGDFAPNSRVDDIISGNTKVGNADKLDGHDSEYFAKSEDLDARIAVIPEEEGGGVMVPGVLGINSTADTIPILGFLSEEYMLGALTILDNTLIRMSTDGDMVFMLDNTNFTEHVTPSAIGAASTADLANYLPKTGGDVTGNITAKSTDTSARYVSAKNSANDITLYANSNGDVGVRSETLSKWLAYMDINGNGHFLGTASGNLPLSGGEIKKEGSNNLLTLHTVVNNDASNLVAFKANNALLGHIGFSGANNPIIRTTAGEYKTIHHDGNSSRVKAVAEASAPAVGSTADTSKYPEGTIIVLV